MSAVRAITPVRRPLDAVVSVPGSKSATNRALVCAALAPGESVIDGVLIADDTEAMLDGLRRLGIDITLDRPRRRATVDGRGGALASGPATVDCRLSGTVSRILTAVAALGTGPYTIDAAPAMRARPMDQLVVALRSVGASIDGSALPLQVAGGGVRGGALMLPGNVSSQYLSALLLAAPYFATGLTVDLSTELVSKPYVEMTMETMRSFGVEVAARDLRHFEVEPGRYRPASVTIEPDATAASYFWAAAAICGGRVHVPGLGRHSIQGDVRFADVLALMGATVEHHRDGIDVSAGRRLHGITIDMADISDTVPTLAVVAAFAEGTTRITGVGFIRRKESDRIGALVSELRRCGVSAHEEPDGLEVVGSTPHGARVETHDDHRMAMSFALVGLMVPGIEIADPGCVAKTFPDYFDVLATIGPPSGAD